MPTHPWRAAGPVLLAGLALLAGCPSIVLTSSARTVEPGQGEQAIALGAQRIRLVDANDPFDKGDPLVYPVLDYAVRFGLSDRVDLELRASAPWSGLSIGPRFQLYRGPEDAPGIDLMAVGLLGVSGISSDTRDDTWGSFAGLAFPVGISFGGGHQLVLAPRATWIWSRFGDSTLLGGSVALVLRIHGDARHGYYLIPECGTADVAATRSIEYRGPIVQCALGFAERRALEGPLAATVTLP
jgi:hypothetical protein